MQFPRRIYLVGFMGCGKTHTGRQLADQSGYTFLDLDEQIELLEGYPVAEVFNRSGEGYFREKERQVLRQTSSLEGYIIACGGGTPCFFDNVQWMNAHGLVVFLDIPVSTLASRLEKEWEKRPLLKGIGPTGLESFIASKLEGRRSFYEKAALRCEAAEAGDVYQAIADWCSQRASFAGIDYGSKLAGTTAIAFYAPQTGQIEFLQSTKGQDADEFLLAHFSTNPWTAAFLDAPLSLPGVYGNPGKGGDYFLREADRQAKAMSPMFLGGLTARAMRIKALLEQMQIKTIEVYPGKLARLFGLHLQNYKKKEGSPIQLAKQVQEAVPCPVDWNGLTNWHAFDALLAYTTGWRYMQGHHQVFGDPEEGQIII
jgi:shikimate kinase/predicted nuclease with RNAse H fold